MTEPVPDGWVEIGFVVEDDLIHYSFTTAPNTITLRRGDRFWIGPAEDDPPLADHYRCDECEVFWFGSPECWSCGQPKTPTRRTPWITDQEGLS